MPKVQDLFTRADGSKLLDTKLLMRIQTFPTTPIQKDTQRGNKIDVYPMQLEHQGQLYDFELNADQLKRIFTKTEKNTNAVTWQGKQGDVVNVWYSSNKSNPSRPYYAAEPANTEEGAAAAVQVFADGEMVPVIPSADAPAPAPAAKPRFVKTTGYGGAAKTEWDGSPRQGSFRQGLAGMLQAAISNPNIDPRKEEDINAILPLVDKLVEYVRVHSKKLEELIKD